MGGQSVPEAAGDPHSGEGGSSQPPMLFLSSHPKEQPYPYPYEDEEDPYGYGSLHYEEKWAKKMVQKGLTSSIFGSQISLFAQ